MNYQIGDLVIRLKNASMARRKTVALNYSTMGKNICDILVKEGFLQKVTVDIKGGKKQLVAELRYQKRLPALSAVSLVSKPSLRVYKTARNLALAKRTLGLAIISTSNGIMSAKDAKKKGIGGELLFTVW